MWCSAFLPICWTASLETHDACIWLFRQIRKKRPAQATLQNLQNLTKLSDQATSPVEEKLSLLTEVLLVSDGGVSWSGCLQVAHSMFPG